MKTNCHECEKVFELSKGFIEFDNGIRMTISTYCSLKCWKEGLK